MCVYIYGALEPELIITVIYSTRITISILGDRNMNEKDNLQILKHLPRHNNQPVDILYIVLASNIITGIFALCVWRVRHKTSNSALSFNYHVRYTRRHVR